MLTFVQVPYKAPGSDQATWMGVNQRLQRSRIIMVGKYIDDEYANQLIAMMLYLEKESRDKAVALYFNCPGANLRPAMAVFDTLQQMAFPVSTLNLGLSTGMVSFLCAAGDKGMRFALPNARFLMQRTGMEDPYRGQASDIAIEVHITLTVLC
jgi:ATP-dependent Clp protease, protease subunit